jgi:DNA-binding transcriptional MerR regulator/methylmalonyl-CoA mutase cobalamin-binding subunit
VLAGNNNAFMITIGSASRQTGIPAATLRKWETRYGFPMPVRTTGEHRVFHACDLEALLEISRRLAAGQRAGVAIRAVQRGAQWAMADGAACSATYAPEVQGALDLLLQNDLQRFEDGLRDQLAHLGAAAFARSFAIPLMQAVGDLWQQGRLPVYAEHLYSNALQKVVQQLAVPPPQAGAPRFLLASPAREQHTLALVLLDAALREAGHFTVLLHGCLPATEIAAAATAFQVQVVALSASGMCPPKSLADELRSLRRLLDGAVELWVGGTGALRISSHIDGLTVLTSIDAALQRVHSNRWQAPDANPTTQG